MQTLTSQKEVGQTLRLGLSSVLSRRVALCARVLSVAVLLFGFAGVPGCGGATGGGAADGRPMVVATTTMIEDLARQIAGDDARVVGIMKTGQDPHIYDVTPRDATTIREADLVLCNGLHLEATLAELIQEHAGDRAVALAEQGGIEPLSGGDGLEIAPDPHCWMDVAQFKRYAERTRDALIELDPEHAAGYRERAEAYIRELDALDAWVREQLSRVPEAQRVIVTGHDAFAYYGRAYGVEVHGVIGISTEQEPRPQDVQALEALVRERNVRALFFESSVSANLNQIVRRVADGSGATIGGELYADSLGEPDSEAGTYIGMMRHNTTTIVNALLGE